MQTQSISPHNSSQNRKISGIIHMETEKTMNSQSNPEQKEQY
jgi:hypothetical protein